MSQSKENEKLWRNYKVMISGRGENDRQQSLAVNIIYNAGYQIIVLIVPLITSPYVARVLGAAGIGMYSYTIANSSYFLLLENMGISLYGQIKIASYRDDPVRRNELFWGIITLKLILGSIIFSVYTFFIFCQDVSYHKLYLVHYLYLCSGLVDITWFMYGIEQFKKTVTRNLFVRLINTSTIFLFVKESNDLIIYALIMQLSTFLGQLFLWVGIIKYVGRPRLIFRDILKHFRASIVYFVPGLVNTIFSSSDKTILGSILHDHYEVGMYEEATKITNLCMSVISSVGNVILPRITYLYNNEKRGDSANRLFYLSLQGISAVAIPVALGIAAISDKFIPLFLGSGYNKSAVLLKILSINVLLSTISNIFGQQCLVARGRQIQYNIAISIAALLNVILNFVVVNTWASLGVSYTSVISSLVCFVIIILLSKDMITWKQIYTQIWKYFLSGIVMFICVSNVKVNFVSWYEIIIKISIGIIVYFMMLFILKDYLLFNVLKKVSGYKHERNQ